MRASFALARAGGRKNRKAHLGLMVVVALGLGVSIAALNVADRTEHAYPDYLRQARVGHLVVNPSLATDRSLAILRSLPGVTSIVSDSLLNAGIDDGTGATGESAVPGDLGQVRMSTDGRYQRQDRPVIRQGRMVRSTAPEAFLDAGAARTYRAHVGDRVEVVFVAASYSADPSAPKVLGRARVKVVGIGTFPDEGAAERLYPRVKILLSPAAAARFDCLPKQPAATDPRPLTKLADDLLPGDCATDYHYYSLRLARGDAGVAAVSAALAARLKAENARLPAAMRQADVGYSIIPSVTADDARQMRRSLAPAVTALRAFGGLALLATLVLALLVAFRLADRAAEDTKVWRALGLSRRERTAAVALPLATAALIGFLLAIVVALAGSPLGPVGSARSVAPAGHLHLAFGLTALTLAVAAAIALAGLLLGARSATAPADRTRSRSTTSRSAWLGGRPSLQLGWRAAVGSSGSKAVIGAAIVAVVVTVGALTFTTSIDRFVHRPAQFGWPYDAAAIVNAGYGPNDAGRGGPNRTDALTKALDDPDVVSWGLAAIAGGIQIHGATLPSVAGRRGFDQLPIEVVSGRRPTTADELAVGSLTARHLGLHVGERVMVTTPYGRRAGRITAFVVLPPIGPFEADRAGLGNGVLLPSPFFEALLRPFERAQHLRAGQLADSLAGFVAIDLGPGVDPAHFLATHATRLRAWSPDGTRPLLYPAPVPPSGVDDVAAIRSMPSLLAGLLVLTMALGLALGIASATRARRSQLGLFRALGATGPQVRASVRWHALAVVAIGLAAGLPLGVAAGRQAFIVFAHGLGVGPHPFVSLGWTALVGALVTAVGLLAAAYAVWSTRLRHPSSALRLDPPGSGHRT